ncbi:sensor domain-containing protein [Halodesulfovibrio marinisediminis]|uniref:PAS domain S-box-containing protein/diguanylate cyclase (GGDEF) domain-containing protein n=1 Tax=Halodesulfovibrio marinisediminis DSM 17456 TaxID=1121457 RepID=A0A1N6DRS5_9BACT|nr:sensor domain-containing diguanylate cyclase [Halodesulfovibrio marinisediminis]SIN73450.1 PAS domain S-box-containing protein/diguanylate cyclase (GGDEF) domain-containing protein [Halodesulfovibrio marinisediminis DSM 17456]
MTATDNIKNCLLVLEHDADAVLGNAECLNQQEYNVCQCGVSIDQVCSELRQNPYSVLIANTDCDATITLLHELALCPEASRLPVICCCNNLNEVDFDRAGHLQPFAWLPLSCPAQMFECTVKSACSYSRLDARHDRAIEKYKLIAQNIPESVVMLDEAWRVDFANEHLGKLVGASDSFEGTHISTLLDAETLMRLQAVCSTLDGTAKQNFQGYVVTFEEEMVPVWFSVSKVGASNNILCVMTNLEENLQAEAALREAEAKYRALYLNAAEGMFRIEESGQIIEANPAFNRIFGFEVLDWASATDIHNFSDRFVARDDFINLMEQVQTVGRQSKFNAQLMRRDGTPIWGEISAHWSIDPKNQIPYVEGILSDVTERRCAELDLQRRATLDCLTGVFSRGSFYEKLNSILATARYEQSAFAVLYIDLNDFKNVNDTHGHHCGDIVIKELAKRINAQIREHDVFGRIGGDEFCIVLENVRSTCDVDVVVRKIHRVVDVPIRISATLSVSVGVSVGVAMYPEDGDTPEVLLQRADQAMYLEKRS